MRQVGYLGLGKMGGNMVVGLREKGIVVVAWNRSPSPLASATTVDDLLSQVTTPRVMWLMLPAGEATDQMLEQILPKLAVGDVVVDGSNSLYKDAQRRSEMLAKTGIELVDVGVSGGPTGARNGACLMIGGKKEVVLKLDWLWLAVSAPQAWAYVGPSGAGHFAKMVHNGIEYGMMEAIAEGAEVLKKSEFGYDLAQVFGIYNKQSVIESRLVGWAQSALEKNPTLAGVSATVAAGGEGEWTVQTAKAEKSAVGVIEEAVRERKESGDDSASFKNKLLTALRGEFGGHATSEVAKGDGGLKPDSVVGGK